MHIFCHQGYRHLPGGPVWRLLDHIFVDGPQAENPYRVADSDRSVFCVPFDRMPKQVDAPATLLQLSASCEDLIRYDAS